jgi:DNA-binding CsgD family transcriptional regulator
LVAAAVLITIGDTQVPPDCATLLRRFRVGVRLSQLELASRAGLSERGISDLERRVTVKLLDDALGLTDAEHTALAGSVVRSRQRRPTVASTPTSSAWKPTVLPAAPISFIHADSRHEVEVLRLVAGGYTNREVAHTLVIGAATVKRHMDSVFAKLGGSSAPPPLPWPFVPACSSDGRSSGGHARLEL